METRSRNYSLVTYHSRDVIQAILDSNTSKIRHYAYILHDKDVKEDGTPKEPHTHIILHLRNAMTLNAVCNLFPSSQNTFGQIVYDKISCVAYLNHRNALEKYQYDDADIISNDIDYFNRLTDKSEKNDDFMSILDDIIARVPMREMVRRYGRDFVINYQKYRDMAITIREEETPKRDFSRWVVMEDRNGVTYIDPVTGETVYKDRLQLSIDMK